MGNKFKTNPNDAAFARPVGGTIEDGNGDTFGLTKREYFAAMILQGLLSNATMTQGFSSPSDKAEEAIEYANALINALNKEIG